MTLSLTVILVSAEKGTAAVKLLPQLPPNGLDLKEIPVKNKVLKAILLLYWQFKKKSYANLFNSLSGTFYVLTPHIKSGNITLKCLFKKMEIELIYSTGLMQLQK